MTATKTARVAKVAATAKTEAKKSSPLIRLLSTVCLISSSAFAKLSAATQTKTLGEANGLPIEFVPDFVALSNRHAIRDALLAGKDVSRELEFNEIVLDETELTALKSIMPILTKINGIGPVYPWLPSSQFDGDCGTVHITRNGYKITVARAKAIWLKASKFWSGGKRPSEHYTDAHTSSYNKTTYYADYVKIGCQSVPRTDLEALARHYNWDPVVA
jgi:hypothetical protein